MQCRDARALLAAQRDSELAQSDALTLQEHLSACATCWQFEQTQHHIDSLLSITPTPCTRKSVSTNHIMLAVHQHRQISQQLEDLRQQQRTRVAKIRSAGTALFALIFFTIGSLPLLLIASIIIQTDLMVQVLRSVNGTLDVLFILVRYSEAGLNLIVRNNLLLSGLAFAAVVMMGLWFRLMRYPQDA